MLGIQRNGVSAHPQWPEENLFASQPIWLFLENEDLKSSLSGSILELLSHSE